MIFINRFGLRVTQMDTWNNDINLTLFNFVKREDVLLARGNNNNHTSATVSRIKINKKRINQRKRIKQLFSTSSKSKAAPQQQHNGLIHVPDVPQIGQFYGGGEPPEDLHHEQSSADDPASVTNLMHVGITQIIHFFKNLFTKKPPQVGQIGMITDTSVNSSEESIDRHREAQSVSNCDCKERRIHLMFEALYIMVSKNMNMDLRIQKMRELQQIDPITYHFMTCPVAAIVPPQAGRARSESHISICIDQSGPICPEPDEQLVDVVESLLPPITQIENEDDVPGCDCDNRRLNLLADYINLMISKNKSMDLNNQILRELLQIDPITLHFNTCPAAPASSVTQND